MSSGVHWLRRLWSPAWFLVLTTLPVAGAVENPKWRGVVTGVDEYRLMVGDRDFYLGPMSDIPREFLDQPINLIGQEIEVSYYQLNEIGTVLYLRVMEAD